MHPFHRQLRRIRLLLQAGRIVAAVIFAAALAAILWLAFGLLDVAFAFEPSARTAISRVLAAAAFITLVTLTIRAARLGKNQTATHADACLADPRNVAAAAATLTAPDSTATPLHQWLASRTLDDAAATLATLKPARLIPWPLWRKAAILLAIPLAITGILRLAAPEVFATVASRLLHPGSDIPPYSPLVFTIDPAEPQTTFGGDILITATITGGDLDHPAETLVRRIGRSEILHLPAFRETPTRYSRKLDGLTDPVEVAFAVGKARSKWTPVEILLEPRILAGTIHITPPAYTGLTTTSFPLDTNEISALEGSSITLELTSNRPLATGSITLTPAVGGEIHQQTIPAKIPSQNTASFTWTATRAGRLRATVADLRGTPTAEPLDLALRVNPDQPPAVDLTSPPRFLLATPETVVPVHGTARDDFALARLQIVRTLAGFRDRIRVVAPSLHEKSFEFQDKLDLYDLGLEAGQIIEVMLEARDHNPSLLGHGSSEISRIKIISEEEYAEYIRLRTTTEEFSARFQAVREAIEEASKALEEMRDAEDPQAAKENAREALEKAADLMDDIAGDFPAFELENRLKELAEQQAEALRDILEQLENDPPDIDNMLEQLGRNQQQQQQLDDDAQFARDAARILEMAAKFREIYENQVSVTKRFRTIVEEFMRGDQQNRRQLPALADTQEKNREALDSFKIELRKRIEALENADPALGPMIDSALRFLQELDVAQPETLMDAATTHGKAGQANEAFTNAELARALLERLLQEEDLFQQAAMGEAPEFDVPRGDINRNIQQMLEAMLGRIPGQGQGQGGGAGQGQGAGQGGFGAGGNSGSGFSMDLPVVGPDRLRFDPLATQSGAGGGDGGTGAAPPLPETAETGTIDSPAIRDGEATTLSPESIPEPYREAVKKYFTP
ncbi:MAG: hypothetical protein ACNA8L_13660 [Luteolibacter sp.]